MKIGTFLDRTNLEHTLLIGYYGGGNYGDELLLEVLANLLTEKGIKDVTVTYQNPVRYKKFHHDFGYKLIRMSSKQKLAQAARVNRNIVIGGGGLWGLDVNANIFILSILLFFARHVLRKKVYLLGVGYYNSTSRLGKTSAWLAGKAANHIIARDRETLRNFQKVTKRVSIDADLAWCIPALNLAPYQMDLKSLEQRLTVKQKTLFITLRRFKPNQPNNYTTLVEATVAANPDKHIIVSLMEPKEVDPEGYKRITSWQKKFKHVQATDFSYNPLALYLFFRKHHKDLVLIGPQFHIIITASITKNSFFPLAYDNKVSELFRQLHIKSYTHISRVQPNDIQAFIDGETT